MTAARATQAVAEVLRQNTAVNAKATQAVAEVLRKEIVAINAQVTQAVAEVLRKEIVAINAQVTQAVAEVLRYAPPTTSDLTINTDAVRCILVEAVANVSGVETTRYISSRPYADSVNGRIYLPILRGSSVQLVERLSIDGRSTMNFGDVEFDNTAGDIDSWLDDVWASRAITVLVGDVRWARSQFEVIFNGIVEDIGSRTRHTLNLKLRDKLQRLNAPVSETKLGGSTSNKNELLPLCFGECFNVSPLLTDPATLEYQVHHGSVESTIEVRDNGVPVSFTASASTGKFTLAATPAGKITASVQGELSIDWKTTVRGIVQRLVTAYGYPASNRFGGNDLDLYSLDLFDAANPEPIGVYLNSRENVLSLCSQIAASVGAQLVMSREGKLQLIKLEMPPAGTHTEINSDDIIAGLLHISEKIPVEAAFKIGYCRNWTVQTGLLTGIPTEHKALFEQEWLTVVDSDATVKTTYKLNDEPRQIDTYLLTEADATTEATRLLDLFKEPRFIVSFESPASMMNLRLGEFVTITHSRFGMSSGKNGMAIGLSLDWDKFTVKVEALI